MAVLLVYLPHPTAGTTVLKPCAKLHKSRLLHHFGRYLSEPYCSRSTRSLVHVPVCTRHSDCGLQQAQFCMCQENGAELWLTHRRRQQRCCRWVRAGTLRCQQAHAQHLAPSPPQILHQMNSTPCNHQTPCMIQGVDTWEPPKPLQHVHQNVMHQVSGGNERNNAGPALSEDFKPASDQEGSCTDIARDQVSPK